jgi:ParB-like chromosome segregation protein Spo0J
MKKFRTYIAELKVERPNAKDTLGIKRDKMPQVRSKDYDELIAHLKKNGVSVQKKSVKATKLKATQSDFNVDKIVDKISSIKTLGKAKPLIVSSDSYIIDGHHRWLAAKNVGGSIDVMQSNVKVKELLKHVYSFPKTFTKGINE